MEKAMDNEMESFNVGNDRGYSPNSWYPLSNPCSSPLYNPLSRSFDYSTYVWGLE